MTQEHKMSLEAAGVNLHIALDRFMNNEALYEKFLRKFPNDQVFTDLKEHLLQKDWKGAFVAAHTLKGICGNLGLSSLTDIINPLADRLREQATNNVSSMDIADGFTPIIEQLDENYQKICSIIKSMS